MNMIYLTAEQADTIRGVYDNIYALDPIACADGFVLPVSVLASTAYDSVHAVLASCPIIEVTFTAPAAE